MMPNPREPRPETCGDVFNADSLQTVDLMPWSNHLHHFLYLLHSTQRISALPFYQTGGLTADASPALVLTQASNETSQAQYLDYLCAQDGPPSRNIPLGKDCDFIMDFVMPLTTGTHEFHGNSVQNDQDVYKLPYQEQFRTCAVVVDLVAGFTKETSSWLYIRAISTALTSRCVNVGLGLGGSVRMGSNSRISISVFGSLREMLESNETTS